MVISVKRDFKTIVLYDPVNSSSLKFIFFRLNGTEMFLIFGQNWGSGWFVMWEGSGGVPLYNYMLLYIICIIYKVSIYFQHKIWLK